jgi:hypothetical protein
VLWIGWLLKVTGKSLELVAPVMTTSSRVALDESNTATAAPLSFPLPPRYEK